MKTHYSYVKFGDFVEIQPTVKIDKETDYSFIPMEAVIPGLKYVYPKDEKKYDCSGVKFENYDIIFARITPCLEHGKIAIARGLTKDKGFGSTEYYIYRAKPNISDKDFIYYLAISPIIKDNAVVSMIGASGRQRAQKDVIENLIIRVPNLPTQKKISAILSAYDDLIDTNRRRIQLLEKAARLLFREWFVYFRFPGHEKVKIVDGVPEGWGKVPFGDVVDYKEGPGLRNYQFKEEGIPFLNIRTFSDDEIDFNKVSYLDETEVYSKYKHFLLQEDDHVISSSGTLGRLVTIRSPHLPLMLNTSLIRMRPKLPLKKWFLKAYLLYGDFIEKATSLAIGAAQLNFGPAHLYKMNILLPSKKIIDEFDDYSSAIYLTKKNLLEQNQKLAQARDLLLPRLMSGAIEV